MIRLILGPDKFREYVDTPVRFLSEIFVRPIANLSMRSLDVGAFHVGIITHLKLNTLVFQRVLKVLLISYIYLFPTKRG